jgi:chromosome segregation ATPase
VLHEERDALQQSGKAAAQHLQELEDALVAVDQERATAELQNKQLAAAVETAYAECGRLEDVIRAIEEERRVLRLQQAEADRNRKTLVKQLSERDAELAKAISMQDHKVIEHVHVLEKAKVRGPYIRGADVTRHSDSPTRN